MQAPELLLDAETLQHLGVGDLAELHRAYLATGAPRSADRFLAWLQDRGVLSGPLLGRVHASRPVDLVAVERVKANPTQTTEAERRYEFLGQLGKGGMGEVILAREKDLRRPIALKVLSAEGSDDTVRRFLTEATITAQLDHPNIVPVYGLEHMRSGEPALAMKLVYGDTFAELAGRGVDLVTRLEYFVEACSALSYAHARGVLHRDIKPENLMVGGHRDVYVVDWGIAKLVGASEVRDAVEQEPSRSATETQAGTIIGTPAYMSPEQASAEPLGPASDQYALGLVLYELVCERRANPGKDAMRAAVFAMNGEIRPIKPILADNPRDLAAIIRRATAFEAEDRYPSVAALAEDVRRYLRGEPTMARPDNLPRKLVRWSRRHPLVLWTLITLALMAAGAVAMLGLIAVIGLQVRSQFREAAIGEVVSTVSHRGQQLDAAFVRLGGLAGGLAKAGERRFEHGNPDGRAAWGREAFEADAVPGLVESAVYGKKISLDHPLVWRAPGLGAEAEAEAARLVPLHEAMVDVSVRSVSEAAAGWSQAQRRAAIADTGVPATLVYVAYENGIYLEFPGEKGLSAAYDARKRPWYREALGTRGPSWGTPYPAASGLGLLVPCRAAMYRPDGSFLGVAGLTLLMDVIVEEMALPDVDGVVETYLLDRQGRVVVQSSQAGQEVEAGLHGNKAVEKPLFDVPSVLAAVQGGELSGYHAAAGHLYVHVRLGATGWTYVVELED